ncbi:hypothetical protein BHF68_06425 [Desulfuribacillus alkaliarsenatis]|uniref:PDZ domain-containing protein n=2 Tax=Desulfuribacillus alkaliarsenatis TaxID=766136 RepID=A0A1E5G1J3_9FIRM|nr:hypothetical protein BHF68_06425 [Desulfuribacillus alkaliarsenatis]
MGAENMRKILFGFLLGAILMASVNVSASSEIIAQLSSFNFTVNGEQRQVENQPIVYNDRSYLPVREVANLLGYDVDYDPETRSIILTTPQGTPTNVQQNQQTQETQGQIVGDDFHSPIIEAVEKAKHSVVGVVNLQRTFRSGTMLTEAGTGSGVIYMIENGNAYIITNHHVIENAHEINVSLPNGDRINAELIGSDELTDLAVLRANASELRGTTVISIGDSNQLRQGEPAIAIGNPLGQRFAQTVTVGVVSGTNRLLPVTIAGSIVHEVEVIQTDAAINFGNSGGALVDVKGNLIGINSAKIAQSGVEGIGFAIPISNAMPVISDLMEHGYVVRPYLGITPRDVQSLPVQQRAELPVNRGVIIAEQPIGPAQQVGLQMLDIIVAIDGEPVNNVIDLRRVLFRKSVGQTVIVAFYRGQDRQQVQVQLAELPNSR